jgi:hypothetical protein
MQIGALPRVLALVAALLAPAAGAHAFGGDWCHVTEVYAFSDRVHVKCNPAPLAISYFAVPTSNSAVAARFISMASLVVGGYLWIDYEFFDTSGPSFGCQLSDCRRALSWKLAE